MHSVWFLWFVIRISNFICYENLNMKNGGPLEPANQSQDGKTMLKVHLVTLLFLFFIDLTSEII